ncbi:hypothetical protein HC555_16085, partial [Escherichia coli]|nr:hypothetical protein [Escherichia coli]
MQTYNTNPAYEMAPQLLEHFNQHLDSLFGVYSKLLPFRMDFAYRKNTLSYRCCHERCNSDPHPTPEIRSR